MNTSVAWINRVDAEVRFLLKLPAFIVVDPKGTCFSSQADLEHFSHCPKLQCERYGGNHFAFPGRVWAVDICLKPAQGALPNLKYF